MRRGASFIGLQERFLASLEMTIRERLMSPSLLVSWSLSPQSLATSHKKAAREAVRRFASFHSRRAEHDGEIVEISAEWFFLFFCLFVGKNAHAASVHTDERSGLSPEERSHRARA